MNIPCISCLFLGFLIVILFCDLATAPSVYDNINPPSMWRLNESNINFGSYNFVDGSNIRYILLSATEEALFACGFFCNGTCTSYIFGIIMIPNNGDTDARLPQVIWAANRDYPVRLNAILNFASGELVLHNVDGSFVWNTNTIGKSVTSMNLIDTGNLVLYGVRNSVVWQSFDYPSDSLLPGQRLFLGQKLIPSVSLTNLTAQRSRYSLEVGDKGLFAYFGSDPPQEYFNYLVSEWIKLSYIRYLNGSLSFFIDLYGDPSSSEYAIIRMPKAPSAQYMKLMPDGHLKVLFWQESRWQVLFDVFSVSIDECQYPLACGMNGICSGNQQCSCPRSRSSNLEYFRGVNDLQQPDSGCYEVDPIICNATQDQDQDQDPFFITLQNIKFLNIKPDTKNVDLESCKQACLNICTCKASIFRYSLNSSSGDCYLPSKLYTLMNVDRDVIHYNTSAFIKVKNIRLPTSLSTSKNRDAKVLGSIIGSTVFLLIVVVGFVMFAVHKRKKNAEMEDEYIDQVPGMPTRFSYEELKTATNNFSKKLGEGGFGTVFEGILEDGSKIATKCLDGFTQVNKSFLAEVESIGSIHHVNLVRLVGFSALKSQRFLVYEFMSNGSLDRWIYHRDPGQVLEWERIKKIILDVAKGLAYLHEDCRQKIIHLDIKPQNILLDNDFNAKVSDFGLSKLVDKNESQLVTTIKGTPGYIAPEWWSSVITEKVDVYSFGIVLLEMLCGRKIFDRSLSEDSWHLVAVFQKCWEQDKLLDVVDRYNEDMQAHGIEVVEMMKLGSWCLQTDFTRRPSMSSVVKVLEGGMEVELNLDYNFTDPRMQRTSVVDEKDLTQLLPSFLSGPR